MKRTVIIIGATGGIGEVLYDRYHREALVNSEIEHVTGTSRKANFSLDITNPKDCEDFADTYWTEGFEIINCAGINYNSLIEKSDYDKWREVIETNLIGSYNLLKAFTPIMKEQGYGRFMFMSSIAEKGLYGASAYSASKAGLEGLVKSAAKELLKYNITVNALRLGYFNTGLINDVPKRLLDEVVLPSTAGELCDSTNLFDIIEGVFKCKDITGSIINVDRGI
jgi:NAD(P)-dependent dehydrogenase (short-subunit alcohol dehydrogenase family)